GADVRPGPAVHAAARPARRLVPVPRQLLLALPPQRPARVQSGHRHVPRRFPLRDTKRNGGRSIPSSLMSTSGRRYPMLRNPKVLATAFIGLGLLFGLQTPAVQAQKKQVKPGKEWSGSVANEKLAKDAPSVITSAKALAKLWKDWQLADKVPEIDFAKEI